MKKQYYDDENKLPEIKSKLIENKIGYLKIPEFIGNDNLTKSFAKSIQKKIKEIDKRNPSKWIIDLRYNRGGNMWPMFLGLAPILKNGTAGYFMDSENSYSEWSYSEGSVFIENKLILSIENYYHVKEQNPEIAVLIGNNTASSGEAVATMFKGFSETKFFGQETYGLTTGNEFFKLCDGATLVLTISRFTDRNKKIMMNRIKPDIYTETPKAAAIKWLTNHRQHNSAYHK